MKLHTGKIFIFVLLIIFVICAVLVYRELSKPKLQEQTQKTVQSVKDSMTKALNDMASPSAALSDPNAQCHEQDGLPDPNCTPGSVNPSVTQENIYTTICSSGYTKTVRPPASYTGKLKRQQMIEYGYSDTDPRHYEEDHLISLELGGNPTDPKNLWPEPGASPNEKDTRENICHLAVCDGGITLQEAQKEIASNWKTACQR